MTTKTVETTRSQRDESVFVALQEDAQDVAVVGVFRSLRAAAESFGSTEDA
ncbi:hypothetical protein ABZ345_05450 [Lentzea sp. NPDC005914]|uniref:hypothetical protein n=1 Tax=Lentzea sp. NPDC005914 TaxID=3154572 RepID=UPI0033F7E253